MERCGKINASNSGSESWTGIGVVAGCGAVVLIMQWPHGRNGEGNWGIVVCQMLQEVRVICNTRNQLACLSHCVNHCGSAKPIRIGACPFHYNPPLSVAQQARAALTANASCADD